MTATALAGNFSPNPITVSDSIGSEYIYCEPTNGYTASNMITASSGITIKTKILGNCLSPVSNNSAFAMHFILTATTGSFTLAYAGNGFLVKLK